MRWELMISGESVVMPWNLYFCPSCWNCVVNSLKYMRMGPRVCNNLKQEKFHNHPCL
jgi:hypothetical protein